MTVATPTGRTYMQVEIINQSREQAWDKMVEEHPFGCVFHTSAFKRVISETFSHMVPYYLALVDENRNVKGGLPLFLVKSWLTGRRLVSLPFAFYSDPLVHCAAEFSQLFVQAMRILKAEKASYLEIKARNSTDCLQRLDMLQPVFYHKTFWIDLTPGIEDVWQHLQKTSVQQRIRRSAQEGVLIRSATSEQDIIVFHEMLTATRKRLGLPPQKREFFLAIWKYLGPRNMADFLIAELRGRPIGGINIYMFGDTVYAGYLANDPEYWRLGVDQALSWRAIQTGVRNHCRVYDIGKTSPYAERLIAYKERWGAHELVTPCFYYPCLRGVSSLNNERTLSYKVMTMMWRRLPDCLLRMGGRFAYRHLG